jgi:hypothetical protein
MSDDKCDACGAEHANIIVGGHRLCRLCSTSECLDLARKVARLKHKAKLEALLREAE